MAEFATLKSTTPKRIAVTDLVVESQTETTSARHQLFSFPKPPAQRTPSSPLLHLCIDTDSRKGSSRFGTPPSTADSSPSFATFLQHRPSTSISGGEGTVASTKTLMARATVEEPVSHSVAAASPNKGLYQSRPNQTLDDLTIQLNSPSPLRCSGKTSEQSHGDRRIPLPKALSPRAVPLFIFLRNDTLPQRIAAEGISEWIEHWVGKGIRVRILEEELDVVKEKLVHLTRLVKNECSADRTASAITKIEEIFAHRDITSRVPPGLYRYPALMADDEESRLDEEAVIECLVRINAGLTAPDAWQTIDERSRITSSGANHAEASRTLPSVPQLRDLEDCISISTLLPQSANVTRSPKARRILGMDVFPQSKSRRVRERSASIMRRSETMSTLSTHLMKISPKSRKEPPSQSTDAPQRRSSMRSNLMRSNLIRTNSLSGARSHVTTLLGDGTKTQNVREAKPGRAEKYLRGVLDVCRQTPGSPKKAERKAVGDQTRSAPAGRRLFTQPPVTSERYDNGRDRTDHARRHNPPTRQSFAIHETALVSGMRLPTLHAEFPWENGHNRSKSSETFQAVERAPAACVAEVQIREVILEYIYGTLRGWKGDDEDYGDHEGEASDNPQVSSLIGSLNRISFDTRFKILESANATIHPWITSAIDDVRFSLGFVNAKQLANRLERIPAEFLPDARGRRRGTLQSGPDGGAKRLLHAWVRARSWTMDSSAISVLIKGNILPAVSESTKIKIWDAFQEAMLWTTTIPHPGKNHIDNFFQQTCDTNERIDIMLRELVDILSSTAAALEIQERLIALFQRERYRCIQSGQGWHLPLDPLPRARDCGVKIMALTLSMFASSSHTRDRDQGSAQKALETARCLFGIPLSKGSIEVFHRQPRRATLPAPVADYGQLVRGFGLSGEALDNGQPPVWPPSRNCDTSPLCTQRMPAIPSNSARESKPEGLRLIILDKSPLEELTHALVALSPAKASSHRETGPSENTSIKVCDTTSQSPTPVMHNGLKEPPAVNVRVSEESTGTATEATSIFATRGSQSTDSQDSLLPGLKPFFGKRAGCLPVVREENQSKGESKRLSLHVHGNRLSNRLASAFSTSSPALFLRNHNSLPATPIDGARPDYPENALGERAVDSMLRKRAGIEQDHSTENNGDQSSSILLPTGGACSGLADLDSAYFDSQGNAFGRTNRPTTVIARPALSFVIPMFNQDSTIRAGMTPGQVEINLLRMIEAERQKCIVAGTVWNHRQIDGLSWLITDVQNLVNDSQLDRVFERVLSSLRDNGSSPITPQRSTASFVPTPQASSDAFSQQSWHSFPFSPLSDLPPEEVERQDTATPRTPNPPIMSMYRHPHRSAVSLQTSPNLPVSSSGHQTAPKPGTGDSTRSKTSSILGAFARYPSLLGRNRQNRFPSWSDKNLDPTATESSLTSMVPYSSAPASLLSSPIMPLSGGSEEVLANSRRRPVVKREAPPPYRSINDD